MSCSQREVMNVAQDQQLLLAAAGSSGVCSNFLEQNLPSEAPLLSSLSYLPIWQELNELLTNVRLSSIVSPISAGESESDHE